ncbi:hypothetical protein [Winogradskyella sp. UBA3174]|uniref:hypothetical protein n=1 Tax=Winogradskyella sp. UBA3174 TaxID=1947785 RepID=UPI0025D4FD0A|nr:hypothetical protein [Winogradskyella sp. UBA3174]|tara:strand:+ start:5338 stop:5829 length:492 start_codon:yes stop_codon:yes gene_type:complete
MVLNNIEKLLEKYDNAETSLKEEAELRAYFESENVDAHLEHYRPMFQYFSQSQKEQYTKDVPLNTNKTRLYQWISVAAVAVLMVGFFIPNWGSEIKTLAEYTPEEQKMYLETKHALAMLSNTFNEGASSFGTLSLASENFNIGLEKASHITEFSEITNRLLKN